MKKTTLLKSMLLLCALIVGSTCAWADTWTRVTSASTLLKGGTFIIGYEATANSGIIVPMANTGSATTSAAGFMYSGSEAASGGSGTIDMSKVVSTSSYEVEIGESSEVDNAIYIKIGDDFLGNTNTKNNCKLFTTQAATTSFTPTFGTNDNVTLDIEANNTGTTKYRYLKYNSSSPRFAVYSTAPEKIVIYKKAETGEETAVDIDDSGITITDIFTSTIGGKLKATVYDESVEAIVGAVVSWESDNKAVAKVGSDGSVTLVGAGTATITASYAASTGVYKSSSETYDLTVTDSNPNPNDGSEEKPYTIAEAIAAYNAQSPKADIDNVYVTGIVKGFYSTDVPNGNGQLSYWISPDGSGNDFEIYNGKSIGGASFTTEPDNRVKVGDKVVVKGTLTYYAGGSVYELKANNQLISKTALTLAKEVGADGWATYIAAGDYEFEPENAFVVASAGTSVSLTPVTKVPSGTPLILKGEGKKWVTALAETPAAPTNSLRISDGAGAGTTNDYVLGRKNGVAGFYKWNGGNLSANKVYLPAGVVTSAHEFLGFDIDVNNEVTTISEVKGQKAEANGVYYNLAGQRVQNPTKGLYILNGKKYIVK